MKKTIKTQHVIRSIITYGIFLCCSLSVFAEEVKNALPQSESQKAVAALVEQMAPMMSAPLTGEQLEGLLHKHEGRYGALAPQNLMKKRPKPPFDLTSTWFVDLSEGFGKFMFGPPYPEFKEAGIESFKGALAAMKKGESYRDSIGECFPAGMPMIMTRVWPIAMIQQPTAIYMMFGFTNSLRIIYLDGRDFSDPDYVIPTYNGESIGEWQGNELVVHTKYFETNEHWVDMGIPISEEFEIIERISMHDNGQVLQIEYTMTDPQNWVGEWKNTKRWSRQDYSDIGEVECLPDLNEHLPSTEKGNAALKEN